MAESSDLRCSVTLLEVAPLVTRRNVFGLSSRVIIVSSTIPPVGCKRTESTECSGARDGRYDGVSL